MDLYAPGVLSVEESLFIITTLLSIFGSISCLLTITYYGILSPPLGECLLVDSDLSYTSPGNTPAVDACSLKALFMELDGPLFTYQPLLLDNNTLSVVRGPVFCFILQLYHSVCTLCDAELHLFILYPKVKSHISHFLRYYTLYPYFPPFLHSLGNLPYLILGYTNLFLGPSIMIIHLSKLCVRSYMYVYHPSTLYIATTLGAIACGKGSGSSRNVVKSSQLL